jgi:hypothetical protein
MVRVRLRMFRIIGVAIVVNEYGSLRFETLHYWTVVLGVAFTVLLIVAALADLRNAQRRNLLHWVGVGQLFALSALGLLMAVRQ